MIIIPKKKGFHTRKLNTRLYGKHGKVKAIIPLKRSPKPRPKKRKR